MTRATEISYLIEAYCGYHEVTIDEAKMLIADESMEKRLETYLYWNGIIGWTNEIISIVEAAE